MTRRESQRIVRIALAMRHAERKRRDLATQKVSWDVRYAASRDADTLRTKLREALDEAIDATG